jgi:hypothetical protein
MKINKLIQHRSIVAKLVLCEGRVFLAADTLFALFDILD